MTDEIAAPDAPGTALVWRALADEMDRRREDWPLRVLDVGGGTGGAAVWFARQGHHVTVVEPSPNALAALGRRAADAGVSDRVRAVQADVDSLAEVVAPGQMDVVLCHRVLEYVDDPRLAVASVTGVLRFGGVASVLVANRAAAVVSRALAGELTEAGEILDGPDGVREIPGGRGSSSGLRRRYDLTEARTLLTKGGLRVEDVHGVGVFAALASGVDDRLAALESRLAGRSPYRDLAAQLHLLGRRTS